MDRPYKEIVHRALATLLYAAMAGRMMVGGGGYIAVMRRIGKRKQHNLAQLCEHVLEN